MSLCLWYECKRYPAKDNKHILDFLGVNSSDELLSCLVIGYPDVKYKRTVPRKDAVINWM